MISFFYVVSYCHLSATLQTISIIVVNLKYNRAVVRIFIPLLKFSCDSPSYIVHSFRTIPSELKFMSSPAMFKCDIHVQGPPV